MSKQADVRTDHPIDTIAVISVVCARCLFIESSQIIEGCKALVVVHSRHQYHAECLFLSSCMHCVHEVCFCVSISGFVALLELIPIRHPAKIPTERSD